MTSRASLALSPSFLRFVIIHISSSPGSPLIFAPQQYRTRRKAMLSGILNSSSMSIVVQPMTTMSTISFPTVYRLGLLPILNRFGHYVCNSSLSVPTSRGFYTSQISLRCCHTLDEDDVILGSDWVSVNGATFPDDGSTLQDPSQSVILIHPHSFPRPLYGTCRIAASSRIFPKHASIMAKKELAWAPLLGGYLSASGAVFVDRNNNISAIHPLKAAGDFMKNATSLWLFPEGTHSMRKHHDLLPFKKGAFHTAVQAGVPVTPVVCENYWRLYPRATLRAVYSRSGVSSRSCCRQTPHLSLCSPMSSFTTGQHGRSDDRRCRRFGHSDSGTDGGSFTGHFGTSGFAIAAPAEKGCDLSTCD